jgi:hypothetical protein
VMDRQQKCIHLDEKLYESSKGEVFFSLQLELL